MTEQKEVGKQPDYKGDGVAVWINEDKNGKKYLGIKVLGSISVNAFKNEPQEKKAYPKVEDAL
jgi:hypothetical protein